MYLSLHKDLTHTPAHTENCFSINSISSTLFWLVTVVYMDEPSSTDASTRRKKKKNIAQDCLICETETII